MRKALPYALGALLVAVLVVGLTQAGKKDKQAAGPQFDVQKALTSLKGAPAPLAALHAQAGQLIDGGEPAFNKRLRELRGHPVVINKWGSWCGPCRTEFPIFQRVGAAQGRTVAFLGVDGFDNRNDATDFLREFPPTYPSYSDPDEKIAKAIGAPANYPITVFIDANGKRQFVHQGQYRTDADLTRDIKRYLGA